MHQAGWWTKRARVRNQGGFSGAGMLLSMAATATIATILIAHPGGPVAAAEESVCKYDKSIVITAIESDRLTDPSLDYATPAGVDGLDEVRSSGWLRSETRYWRYTGLDGSGRPRLELRSPIEGCN